MSRPRLVLYSHDGFGLGHIRRNLAIAGGFVAAVPDSSVALIAGTIPPVLDLPSRVDLIKLPSIRKVATGTWGSGALNLDQKTLKCIRSNIIQSVALNMRPDVMVADYTPTGVWGELQETLQALKGAHPPTKIVLGLRDILDAPETTRQLWLESQAYETVATYYDSVFIYGCKEIFDPVGHYDLGRTVAAKARYCGYICADSDSQGGSDIHDRFAAEEGTKLVVITGGGGGDAYPMMSVCLDALSRIGQNQRIRALLIAGPLMKRSERDSLRERARGLPVTVLPYTLDMPAYLCSADLVVTMGGYNTLMEALKFGKRVLAIPRDGPSAEQRLRAKTFAEHGLIRWIAPEKLSPETLFQTMCDALASPSAARVFEQNGLATVIEHLRGLLSDGQSARAQRQPVGSDPGPSEPARSSVDDEPHRASGVSPIVALAPRVRAAIEGTQEGAQASRAAGARKHRADAGGKRPRIAIFTHDTFGLGHVRRCLHFVRALSEASPGSALLLVTGSPALHALRRLPLNADYVKVPTIARTGTEQSRPPHLPLPIEGVKSLRRRLIYEAISGFEPDVLLVDNFPLGSSAELLPLLKDLRPRRTATVLGLRDILDRPDVVRKDWQRQGIYQVLEDCYDRILVYGLPSVLDVARVYGLTPNVAAKLHYCGYVTRIAPLTEVDQKILAAAGLNSPWVLATVGGGGDGLPLAKAFLRAMSTMPEVCGMAVTGPLMSSADRAELEHLGARCPRVVLQDHLENLPAYMAAADAVVTMGGYNTLAEVLALGCRAVVIPRTWRYGEHANRASVTHEFEQLMRAEAFAKAGLVRVLHPSALEPEALAAEIGAALERPARGRAPAFDVEGVSRVTEQLLSLADTTTQKACRGTS